MVDNPTLTPMAEIEQLLKDYQYAPSDSLDFNQVKFDLLEMNAYIVGVLELYPDLTEHLVPIYTKAMRVFFKIGHLANQFNTHASDTSSEEIEALLNSHKINPETGARS